MEIISEGGEFLSILLIIILSISILIADTKYLNKLNSKTLNMGSRPLLIIFIVVIIFKIILII